MKINRKKSVSGKKRKVPRVDMRRGIYLLPNLITTANLFCGFLSIIKSLQGNFVFAAWLVVGAIFLDFMDGRVARMTGASSDFGCEYDSLSDLVTFVISPAIMAYLFGLNSYGKIGIAAGFLFLGCGALRLARFNVQSSDVEKVDFQGLPTPSAGGLISTYIIFHMHVFGNAGKFSFILLALTVGLALLMVSSVRYRSFKKINRTSFVSMIMMVSIIFVMAMLPQIMFFAFGVVYTLTGIVEWVWKSPSKIRGIHDLWKRFYDERHTEYMDDDDFEDLEASPKERLKVVNLDSDN